MKHKFVYEDFKQNLPSEKVQKQHRAALHEKNLAAFNKQVEQVNRIRKERAPYQKALLEFFNKEKVFNDLPAFPKREAKGAKQRSVGIKLPDHPRLKQRIFQNGSIHLVDLPSENAPYVGWIDDSVSGLSPNNDAEGWGSFDNFSSVSMGISAGEGLNGNDQGGGSAACWGYVGEYFTPVNPCPQVEVLEAQIQFSASVGLYCLPNWTTTYIPFGPTDYAKLTITANLVCLIYDSNWNQINILESPNYSIINQVDQFTGSNDYGGVGFDLYPQLGPLMVPISLNNNYGFFVQFYMFASGNGESTGSLVPGSNADAQLNATVNALQFEALWNS